MYNIHNITNRTVLYLSARSAGRLVHRLIEIGDDINSHVNNNHFDDENPSTSVAGEGGSRLNFISSYSLIRNIAFASASATDERLHRDSAAVDVFFTEAITLATF